MAVRRARRQPILAIPDTHQATAVTLVLCLGLSIAGSGRVFALFGWPRAATGRVADGQLVAVATRSSPFSSQPWTAVPTFSERPISGSTAELQEQDECQSNVEGALWPPYCDGYTYCDMYREVCRLSARIGYFRVRFESSCPPCQAPFRLTAGESRRRPLSTSVIPNASTVHADDSSAHTLPGETAVDQPATGDLLVRVSVSSTGAQATGGSSIVPALSADGRFVAFDSGATSLVSNDTNGKRDVFLHDRTTSQVTRVSVAPGGVQANGDSLSPAISADGRYIAFLSSATNLVSGDTNGVADVFVHDRQSGTTERANLGPSGVQANAASWPSDLAWYLEGDMSRSQVAMSEDGRYVAFISGATNFVPPVAGVPGAGVCIRDRQLAQTSCLGRAGRDVTMSRDGRFVAFSDGGVYIHDRTTVQTQLVSVSRTGGAGNAASLAPSVSDDGRYVAFTSDSTDLLASQAGGPRGIYLRDRQNGTTTMISGGRNFHPSISGDARYVAYARFGVGEVVRFDRMTSQIRVISRPLSGTDASNAASFGAAISADGRTVAFASAATNLIPGDTNGQDDVFVAPVGDELPTMALDRTSLRFGAVSNGAGFLFQTSLQTVRLTQTGPATPVTWTAIAAQPWIQVSPSSGTGSSALTITVGQSAGVPPTGTVAGAVNIVFSGATNTVGQVSVTLNVMPNGTSLFPLGFVDTPTDHATGVTGAIPFTGWALDDVEVVNLWICRATTAGEGAAADARCNGKAQVFLGDGVFIEFARTDVQLSYANFPHNSRAGWGFMVLTNMLPAQGNGTYVFYIYAKDAEGRVVQLGTRTITCANASATKPFGTIDTPRQGDVISGTSYVNFGWALTPQPKAIPTDGSTITVIVDGVSVGKADYNHYRPDVAGFFPGLANTNGAIGFRILDTTALANGRHTISWTVTDNQGVTEGLGSRFFTVFNGAGTAANTTEVANRGAAAADTSADALARIPSDGAPVLGRLGWSDDAPWVEYHAEPPGRTVVRSEEVTRIELRMGNTKGLYAGYLRVGDALVPLPAGSHLDRATGQFTWAPGAGFIGSYDLVFIKRADGMRALRQEVRIVLQPKGRHLVGPQIAIDMPTTQQDVGQPFVLAGWAADLDSPSGTGIAALHVWAYPLAGGPPVFLGTAKYGGARTDVEALHGEGFRDSGFDLVVQSLAPGTYDLAVFAWSMSRADFLPARTVRVTVR